MASAEEPEKSHPNGLNYGMLFLDVLPKVLVICEAVDTSETKVFYFTLVIFIGKLQPLLVIISCVQSL